MKNIKKYALLSIALSTILALVAPVIALGEIVEPPPGGSGKHYGTSYSYFGLFTQGTLSDTFYDDGEFLTLYPFFSTTPVWWMLQYYGYLRISFSGQIGSKLGVEHYNVPYWGVTLKIVYTDGSSKSWSGYHDQYVELSISSKPVNYVQLSVDAIYLTLGSYLQFDRCYLID